MKYTIAAVLVPILALLGWVTTLQLGISNAKIIRIPVEGYDPRDLLSGHYLRYKLKLGDFEPCTESITEACVCFEVTSDNVNYAPNWKGSCNAKPAACKTFISGNCQHSRFVTGLEQFYISEEISPSLKTVPPNATIDVAVSDNGTAQALSFYVDGVDVETYARMQDAKAAATP